MILSHDGLRGAARAMARTVTSPAAGHRGDAMSDAGPAAVRLMLRG